MGFGEAISTCFRKYATFSGRASRSEFWYFFLFLFLVSVVLNIIGAATGGYNATDVNGNTSFAFTTGTAISAIVGLALLLPALAVGARRLHDTGRSGWFLLLHLLCCVGDIILLVFFVGASQPGANQHGPQPTR